MGIQHTVHFLHLYELAQYCLSTTITSLINVWLHVVYIITSIKIQRFKDRETALNVVQRNIPLWGFSLLSHLLTWVSHLLGSSNHLYVTCTFWWDWKCEICEFLWLRWIVAEVLTVLDGRCSSRPRRGFEQYSERLACLALSIKANIITGEKTAKKATS